MWHLHCFGALKAENSQTTIERFRTQKTAALLALLALRGVQSRERLCAALWPDAPPEAARNSLSAALSALRRELGEDMVCADRQSVALAPSSFATDVAEFDAALKGKDFARAVELYQGHLLAGFHEDPFPAMAGEYEEKARGAFSARIEELERAAQPDALRSLARRAIGLFGDDERWFLALMRAHALADDLDAALRAYDALLRHARKVGDVASEAARQLAKTLRREKERKEQKTPISPQNAFDTLPLPTGESEFGTPELIHKPVAIPPSTPVAPLPAQWTRFFGRSAERDLLRNWLQRGERLITLTGAGGSGKTRLAIETLQDENAPVVANAEGETPLASGFGKVYFVSLASLSDASLFFASVRDGLGLGVTSDEPPPEQIARALNGVPCVLLLDNFEQLLPDGAAQLQILREKLPDATLMVTSRMVLRLPGEREFPVSPLPTPLQRMAFEDITECPSVELFCDRAGLRVNTENAEAMGALCRRLDGIPLALELAAARAKVLSPLQIVERLEKHPDFLQSRELGIPARQKTLRATIEWSVELLSPELRDFFARLSVFRGGWTLEAAEAVCNEPDAIEGLTLLRESSLVRVETGENEARFWMLETLREFCQEQLSDEARSAIERTFFDYYLQLAQHAAHAMRGPEQTRWLKRLDIEQDNVRAALTWAREYDPQRGLQLATALIDFWETRLSLQEGRLWIETFLRATAPSDEFIHATRAQALSGAGRLAWYANDISCADSLLEQGLQTAQQAGDAPAVIYATRSLARVTALAGDTARGRALGRDAVELARELGDDAVLYEALTDLGFTEMNASDFLAAAHVCEEAVALARRMGDEHALALALGTLAIAYFYHEKYAKVLAFIAESEAIARRLGARWELVICTALKGRVLAIQGDFEGAVASFAEAIALCRTEALVSWNLVNVLCSVAYALFLRGDVALCARVLGAVQTIGDSIGYSILPFMQPEYDFYLRTSCEILGDETFNRVWEEGQTLTIDDVIALCLSSNGSEGEEITPVGSRSYSVDEIARTGAQATRLEVTRARALSAAGRLAWHGSDFKESRALIEQGLETARRLNDTPSFVEAVAAFVRLAMTSSESGAKMERAKILSEEAVQRSRDAQDDSLLLESFNSLLYTRLSAYDIDGLHLVAAEALPVARRVGDSQRLSRMLTCIASLEYYAGRLDVSEELLEEAIVLARRTQSPWDMTASLWAMSNTARELGKLDVAHEAITEALKVGLETYDLQWPFVNVSLSLAFLLVRRGDVEDAVQVLGAAEKLSESLDYQVGPALLLDYKRYCSLARETLGDDLYEAAWNRGRALTPEQAVEFALSR